MNSLTPVLDSWFNSVLIKLQNINSIWTVYQAAVVAGAVLIALALASLAGPMIERWLRRIEQQPRLLRLLAIMHRRRFWAILAVTLAIAVVVLRDVTWPSNSYFVGVAAYLATAWYVVSVLSRTIRNAWLSRLVEITTWMIAALYIVGWTDRALELLDLASVTFGAIRISLLTLLKGVLVLSLLLWGGSFLGDFIAKRLRDAGVMSPSLLALITKIGRAGLFIVAIMLALGAAGIDMSVLTVFSGALGLGLGFGLQKLASNLASGVIILADRSIKPGDAIEVDKKFGWIRSLNARYVSVGTLDGAEHLIPNEDFITQRVVNWSYSNKIVLIEVPFGVSYDANPHEVRRLALACIEGLPRMLTNPGPACHFRGFGESSLDFTLWLYINDPENGMGNIRGETLLRIWDMLKANGIEIPYPHREVIMRQAPGPKTM
ncbi:MAG: mechanosensitive ion channel [Hyphomicrobiaceae bacterium]